MKKFAKRMYGRLSPEYEENVSNVVTIQIGFEEEHNTIDMYWGGDITPLHLGFMCAGLHNGEIAHGIINYAIELLKSNPNLDEVKTDLELFSASLEGAMKLEKQLNPNVVDPPVVAPLEGLSRMADMYADVEGE